MITRNMNKNKLHYIEDKEIAVKELNDCYIEVIKGKSITLLKVFGQYKNRNHELVGMYVINKVEKEIKIRTYESGSKQMG